MAHFYQTRKRSTLGEKIFYSWPFLFFALGIIMLLGRHIIRSYQNYSLVRKEHERIQEKIQHVEGRTSELQEELLLLEDEKGRDRVMRERFDIRKEGEEVVVIVEEKSDTQPAQKASVIDSFKNFFKRFLNF